MIRVFTDILTAIKKVTKSIRKLIFPIYLFTKYHKDVVDRIKHDYYRMYNYVPNYSHRYRHIVNWFRNKPMDNMTTHSYNHLRTNIYNLEADSLNELLKLRDYFFITNSRIEYHSDRRMTLSNINTDIREDLAYIENIIEISKKKQKPKGQKFCAVDPYGEENWEE